MTPARAGTSAVAGVLGTVLLLVLVTWAASFGPDTVLRRPGPPAGTAFTPYATTAAPVGPQSQDLSHHGSGSTPWVLELLVGLLEVLGAVLLLYLLVRLLANGWDRWRNRERRVTQARLDVDFDVVEDAGEVAQAIASDVEHQRRLLREGDPRNAIVACWNRLEVMAERAGARRRVWQTPSEFVIAIFEVAGANGDAVLELAALYREARFSDHPVTEEHRRAALAALDATMSSLSRARGRLSLPGAAS